MSEDEDGITPGPGDYQQDASISLNKSKKPEKLQFFGSTVERFEGDGVKNAYKQNLGPGAYENPVCLEGSKIMRMASAQQRKRPFFGSNAANHSKSIATVGFAVGGERFDAQVTGVK